MKNLFGKHTRRNTVLVVFFLIGIMVSFMFHLEPSWAPEKPTEFVCTIASSGGDFSTLAAWDSSVSCNLAASTTKVFSHTGIAGTFTNNEAVSGAISGATGTAVFVTDDQILISGISGGPFSSGEKVSVNADGTTYVFLVAGDLGNPAIAVAEMDFQEGTTSTTALSSWTTDAEHYLEIRPVSGKEHTGIVGATGKGGLKLTGTTGSLLSSPTEYIRLTNLYLESTSSSTDDMIVFGTSLVEAAISGCLIHKSSSSVSGDVISVSNGALKAYNNFMVTSNTSDNLVYLTSDSVGTTYIFGNNLYSHGGGSSATKVLNNGSINSTKVELNSNVIFGFSNTPVTTEGGTTLDTLYNAFDGTYAANENSPEFNKKNLTATDHVTDLTAGQEDLHLKTTSSLRGAGWLGLLTNEDVPIVVDIDGTDRVRLDIGADIIYTAPREFVSTIRASGGDYTSITAWNTAVKCDLTDAAVRVFAHTGITGSIGDGLTLTGATSGATGIVLHATDTQVLMEVTSGTFQTGENVASTSSFVTILDNGYPPIAVAECYNDWVEGLDDNVDITGWTASMYLYPVVRGADAGMEFSTSLSNKFLLKPTSTGTTAVKVTSDYARIENMEIDGSNLTSATIEGALCYSDSVSYWKGNIIHSAGSNNNGLEVTSGKQYIWNNFIIDCGDTGEAGIEIDNTGGTAYVYSNSITGCDTGVNVTTGTVIAKNNAALGNTIADFAGTFDTASNYNASSDSSAPTAGNSLVSKTAANNFTNVTAGSEDLHLKSTGDLDGAGVDLSGNAYLEVTDDIDGIMRTGTWDIGADRIDNIWDNSDADGLWNTAANWSLGHVPTAGESVVFNSTSNTDCVTTGATLPDNLGAISLLSGYTSTVTFEKNTTSTAMLLSVVGNININSGNMVFEGDSTVINGGTTPNPYGIGYAITASEITIAEGASMNADETGFAAGYGPGKGAHSATPRDSGAGYGGKGVNGSDGTLGGITYGSASSPTALGSGGGIWDLGNTGQYGGVGGGSIKLNVSGMVTVNGNLSANGSSSIFSDEVGGGSGGSIWISSGTLAGTGTILATGGDGGSSGDGGGGGGCIDISGTTNNFTGSLKVSGGTGCFRAGFTGTIVFPAGHFDDYIFSENTTVGHGVTFGNVTVSSGVTLTLDANSDDYTYGFTSLTVNDGGSVICLGNPWESNVASGGRTEEPHGVGVVIDATDITIVSGGNINANETGFVTGYGPGKGAHSATPKDSGAGYGGKGGDGSDGTLGGITYGSVSSPTALGSGGGIWDLNHYGQYGGVGGGSAKLNVSGTLTVNGNLSANGSSSIFEDKIGGGSGGSIWIITDTLAGTTGTILATGGDGGSSGDGGGGGGRIRVEYASSTFPSGNITATGGTGYENGADGIVNEDDTDANTAPSQPALSYPANAATLNTIIPYFEFSTTDADYDYLRYKVEISTGTGAEFDGGTVSTITQPAVDQTGWYLQTEQSLTAYASGNTANYMLQTPLTASTQYYWRISAIDPGGSNGFGTASAERSFTTGSVTTNYWINNQYTGDGLWSTAANWSKGTAPAAGENIVFNSAFSGTDCSMDVEANIAVIFLSLTLDSSYTKTLTLASDVEGSNTLNVSGDITVNGGNLVCQGNASAINATAGGTALDPYGEGIVLDAANIIVVDGASINADGGGFAARSGPGKGGDSSQTVPGSGGGYGGLGGNNQNTGEKGGQTYGSFLSPIALGSGGGLYGGSGGSAIKLSVTGNIIINGVLSANGKNPVTENSGGGSGGSIWIAAGTLTGIGTISTNGGDRLGYGGSGGGGRIDISGTTNNFTGSFQVIGGTSYCRGYAGTIAFPQSLGTGLTLDDFNLTNDLTLGNDIEYTFGTLTINNGATLTLDGNPQAVNSDSGGVAENPHGTGVTINATTIDIKAGGYLSADGMGFKNDSGPGAAVNADPGAGAGHGGIGGASSGYSGGSIYGSASAPTALGSGGALSGSDGGGAIKLNISNTFTVNGTFSASGGSTPSGNSGGGSGGSLWIITDTLTGTTDTISVAGGAGGGTAGGGGAGGRIKISVYNTNTYFGTITATGGTGYENGTDGTTSTAIVPAPTLYLPADGDADYPLIRPKLRVYMAEPAGWYFKYKILLDTVNTFDSQSGEPLYTFDQAASQTGWSGQNADSTTAYNSGATATYTLQGDLTPGQVYYWKAYAISPVDERWTNASAARSFTCVEPSITVTSPNGGPPAEEWLADSTHNITWTSAGDIRRVNILYSLDSGVNWTLVANSSANSSPYSWVMPYSGSIITTCRVKVTNVGSVVGAFDISDNDFSIVIPTITITSPDLGTEVWTVGSEQSVTWTSTGTITNVALEYSPDNGMTWKDMSGSAGGKTVTGNTGTYSWTIPDDIDDRVLVRGSDASRVSLTLGGTAQSKVSTDAYFEDANKTLVLDVTADFTAGEDLTFSGSYFTNFNSSALDNLGLDIYNSDAPYSFDDKTIAVIKELNEDGLYIGGTAGDGWSYVEST